MQRADDLRLDEFTSWIRREAGIYGAARGLIAGLGAALLLTAAAWLWPLWPVRVRLVLGVGLPALGTLAGLLGAYFWPRTPQQVARQSDERLHLRARLATALEIEAGRLPVPGLIVARQRADAQTAAAAADPRQVFTPRLARWQRLLTAGLIALLAAGLIAANPQDARLAQRQAEQAAIARQVERLEQVRAQIAADEDLRPEDREILLAELDETIRDLQSGDLTPAEALARLGETEERLLEHLEDGAASEQALREAGREGALGAQTQELGSALAAGEYEAAAEAASALGEQLPQMSQAERAKTAARLAAMAEAVDQTNPALAQALRDAAAAVEGGDLEAAQEALDRAAAEIDRAAAQAAAGEAAEQALGQIQEARREIGQAGSGESAGQVPGQGQQGTGQQGTGQQGTGKGQTGTGQTPGEGQTGSGSGTGSGQTEGGGTPGEPGGPIPPNQPGQEGESPYDPIYAPERLGEGEGEQMQVEGEGKGGPPTGEGQSTPPDDQASLVPYSEVYSDYRAQAASALEDSYIPQGVKAYVRAYFSALDPGGGEP